MTTELTTPRYIFETSWEVCNKVGGIYTVLSSRAKTLRKELKDRLVFIGPDLQSADANLDFIEDVKLLPAWKQAATAAGIHCRIGRWQVPGKPVAILVDFKPFFEEKNKIYAEAWELFGVDSLHAYGDYDEASMFSYAAGCLAETICRACIDLKKDSVVYQAHEWMSGLGMLFLKHRLPEVATIFTTHATSIGRSIAGNNKQLYAWFEGYDGDQMASELHMEAKHSIEKQSAHQADCFTTVSSFTNRECKQLLAKEADVVLPNGFENDFVPKGTQFGATRGDARERILSEYACFTLTGVLHWNRAEAFLLPGRLSAKCQVCRPYSHTAAHSGVTTCSILTRSKPHPSTSCRAHSCLPQRKHYPSVGLLTRSSSCMAKTLIFPTACC